MALETFGVYNIATGSTTYPHSGNFTITKAGGVTIDDSNAVGDTILGDATHTDSGDVGDQDATASAVAGINIGDTVDSRYTYAITGSDGSSGNIYFLATNGLNNYGSLIASDIPLDPAVTYTFGAFNTDGGIAYSSLVPCFVRGTRLEAFGGPVPIEDLSVGDEVLTLDNGFQAVRWIGRRRLDGFDLAVRPNLRPILISRGALGPGTPSRDLKVSPQHRVLVRSRIAMRMFGVEEILVPAKKLGALEGVCVLEHAREVEYLHILFDDHQIVFSEGAATESLFLGSEIRKGLDAGDLSEIYDLFPGFCAAEREPFAPARTLVSRNKAVAKLITRHRSNRKSLQESVAVA